MTDPGSKFQETFSDEVTRAMVDALAAAYDRACDLHEPEWGCDEQSFGFLVYKFAVHALCEEFANEHDNTEVTNRLPAFRLRAGEYQLACHKVGHRAGDDIHSCFPGNDNAAPRMVEGQLWLDGVDRDAGTTNLERARKLILAHLGNPEDGLQAVYLCFPRRTGNDGKISEWAYSHLVWKADEGSTAHDSAGNGTEVPDEVIDPVVVRPRKRVRKRHEG